MKNRDRRLGLATLTLRTAIAVSGCSVLEQAADRRFEYKVTLDTNGVLVD